MTLADRIRARLDALNLSADDAAERSGLSRAFVFNLLSGKQSDLKLSNLVKLAGVLRVKLDWFRTPPAG